MLTARPHRGSRSSSGLVWRPLRGAGAAGMARGPPVPLPRGSADCRCHNSSDHNHSRVSLFCCCFFFFLIPQRAPRKSHPKSSLPGGPRGWLPPCSSLKIVFDSSENQQFNSNHFLAGRTGTRLVPKQSEPFKEVHCKLDARSQDTDTLARLTPEPRLSRARAPGTVSNRSERRGDSGPGMLLGASHRGPAHARAGWEGPSVLQLGFLERPSGRSSRGAGVWVRAAWPPPSLQACWPPSPASLLHECLQATCCPPRREVPSEELCGRWGPACPLQASARPPAPWVAARPRPPSGRRCAAPRRVGPLRSAPERPRGGAPDLPRRWAPGAPRPAGGGVGSPIEEERQVAGRWPAGVPRAGPRGRGPPRSPTLG